ncbi:MAG: hypothetical protein IKY90_00340 [Oscillospiraceae bacterium]|nr:hypothetical protein [Oscillospiraceae bacterium]
MKSKGRKVGRRYRNAKLLTTLHAKQGKDRSRQNRQDRQMEEKVKLRGLKIEKHKKETEEKTV